MIKKRKSRKQIGGEKIRYKSSLTIEFVKAAMAHVAKKKKKLREIKLKGLLDG